MVAKCGRPHTKSGFVNPLTTTTMSTTSKEDAARPLIEERYLADWTFRLAVCKFGAEEASALWALDEDMESVSEIESVCDAAVALARFREEGLAYGHVEQALKQIVPFSSGV